MAWTYGNWNDPDASDATRLANLKRYRSEILAAITGPNTGGADMNADFGTLTELYKTLGEEETRLQARVDAAAGGGMVGFGSRRGM